MSFFPISLLQLQKSSFHIMLMYCRISLYKKSLGLCLPPTSAMRRIPTWLETEITNGDVFANFVVYFLTSNTGIVRKPANCLHLAFICIQLSIMLNFNKESNFWYFIFHCGPLLSLKKLYAAEMDQWIKQRLTVKLKQSLS